MDIGVGDMPKGDINVDVVRNPNANLIADGQFLPFRNSVFGRVYCLAVLEHVHDPHQLMREITRVLKLGGEAVFEFPRPLFSHSLMYNWLETVLNPHYWFVQRLRPFRNMRKSISGLRTRHPRYTHLWIIKSDLIQSYLRVEREYLTNPTFPKPLRVFKHQIFKENQGFLRGNVHVEAVKIT